MSDDVSRVRAERPALTAEDLALLATPDADIRRTVEIFSFDDERFKVRISAGERWQQLIQAHLYYDHVITRLLVDALVKPDTINARRLGFHQKLQFVQALGLLPDELVSTVEFINNMRNKIAHDLNFEIDDKDELDLSNCTSKNLRNIIMTDKEREPGPIRFYELLRINLLRIEIIRQNLAFNRLAERKGMIRLRTVLEKTKDAVYRK